MEPLAEEALNATFLRKSIANLSLYARLSIRDLFQLSLHRRTSKERRNDNAALSTFSPISLYLSGSNVDGQRTDHPGFSDKLPTFYGDV